jgi:hypothetical protein
VSLFLGFKMEFAEVVKGGCRAKGVPVDLVSAAR